ncbi:Cation efflux protein [Cordyceps fumosorosea ARSEF 2679]|uniref:Cation efflux protein n=1 Tax=Cordyceps fumosorosea (strain ARSEF 2679) TaxID=1081104 RepID=A0A167LRM2_CORFA|nr:Cation efflux protein [Cordyceps fumosorosea ARSEF 2679]OAA53412.1 Cation efflux protein [Cordyceps fumosorosea ARSEF 2679]
MSRQARRSGRLAVTWCLSVTPSAMAVAAMTCAPSTGGATVGASSFSAIPSPGPGSSGSSSSGSSGPSPSSSINSNASIAIPRPLIGLPSRAIAITTRCGGPSSSSGFIDSLEIPQSSRFPASPSRRSFFPRLPPSSLPKSHLRAYHVYSTASQLPSALSSAVLHLAPTLTRRRLRKLVVAMGHSHSHGGHSHHNHDNSYLVSANKNDPGVRITRIGLLSNLLMAVAKFIGGWAFNSKAMVADAWHSIADMASDILTLATVSWSIKPPSDRFPLGFGKVESLGSLGVSGMLLVGGVYMGWDSGISLLAHFNPETAHDILEHVGHGHGHSHSHSAADLGIPSVHAAWLAAGTILVKEWLYHATMKVARERKSSVLASNAVHHRVDSLTGIVTMAAIIGANVIENAAWLDPVGGLLISIMVIHAGFDNTKSALYELIDQTIDADVKSSIRKQTQGALVNVNDGHEVELRDVSGVKSGQNYLVDLEMAVPAVWTVSDLADVENAVRTEVGARVRGVRRVRVRFVSKDAAVNAKFDEFVYTNLDADPEGHKHENGSKEEHDHKH